MSAALSVPSADELSHRAAVAAEVWDALCQRHMLGGHAARVAAVVENIIAAIQARCEPSEWREAGASTAEAIERRCSEPSAVASVLLRLRPGLGGAGLQAHHLGTDAVGRGAGWHKTANATEIAKACNDLMATTEIGSGELFRALKDIVVAAAHGGPSAREVGVGVARLIERRVRVN
jgi:hypothetical protein